MMHRLGRSSYGRCSTLARSAIAVRRRPCAHLLQRRASSTFQVWAALEERDEQVKLQLARLLNELSKLAAENDPSADASAAEADRSLSVLDHASSSCSSLLTLPNQITPGVAKDAIADVLHRGLSLSATSLQKLLLAGTEALLRDPSVVDLRVPSGGTSSAGALHVVGDLHGSLDSLRSVLALCDTYPTALSDGASRIVFNGDFVDRGEHSVEVLACLLLLKLAHGSQVVLLRGNHEDSHLAAAYGFLEEVRQKYPNEHAGTRGAACSAQRACLLAACRPVGR